MALGRARKKKTTVKAKGEKAKATRTPAPKRTNPKAKAKAKAKPMPKPKAKAKPKTTKPKTPKTTKPKNGTKSKVRRSRTSERVMASLAMRPRDERALDDSERSAMAKVAAKARLLLGNGYGAPKDVVVRIASYVDEVRRGVSTPPRDRDELFGLGVLWGEQLRAQVGWLWVHLTYPHGLSSFALVPDDRAFAVFPINRLLELLGPEAPKTSPATTLAERFEAICDEQLPQRKPNAYLVIG